MIGPFGVWRYVLVDRAADYGGFDRRDCGDLSKGKSMIDLTKPVQTRDGREARVFFTEGGGSFPVLGAFNNGTGIWNLGRWSMDGISAMPTLSADLNLVNIPPKMIKRRLYVTTWGKDSGSAGVNPINGLGFKDLTALNFPIDIEIPEGYGL